MTATTRPSGRAALEDLPHSPLADRVDNQIGAQVELGAAIEQLFCLPNVQHADLDHAVGELPIARRGVLVGLVPFGPAHARSGLVELLLHQQTARQGAPLKHRWFEVAHPSSAPAVRRTPESHSAWSRRPPYTLTDSSGGTAVTTTRTTPLDVLRATGVSGGRPAHFPPGRGYACGYVGTRAVRTWREHIFTLRDLGFIKVAAKGNREIANILLLNPLSVCADLMKREKIPRKIPAEWRNAFVSRASEIGATIPLGTKDNEEPPEGE